MTAVLAMQGRSPFLETATYERSGALTEAERAALLPLRSILLPPRSTRAWHVAKVLDQPGDGQRLIRPLKDALERLEGTAKWKRRALIDLLRGCLSEETAYWVWPPSTWAHVLATESARVNRYGTRQYMIGTAYVLGCVTNIEELTDVNWLGIARKVFGVVAMAAMMERIDTLRQWGYTAETCCAVHAVAAKLLLTRGSPCLDDLSLSFVDEQRHTSHYSRAQRGRVVALSRVLAHFGIVARPLSEQNVDRQALWAASTAGIAPEWAEWVDRWERTSTLTRSSRQSMRSMLLKIGRWLGEQHPEVRGPEDWTRELAAQAVAAVNGMCIGDYTWRRGSLRGVGRPLSPRSKCSVLVGLGKAFSDAQEWGWIPRRFTPSRAFATPRSILALIGPAPRVIADDVWAKLLWAGLNLTEADLADTLYRARAYYPLDLLRALTVVWLFAGLRSDEIIRLPVGSVRWQSSTSADRVCLLDVPINKTGASYTKPVDVVVGEAIEAWEAVRPGQPPRVDRKTGAPVHLLFALRDRCVATAYLNTRLIPALCRKAGVPEEDARGRFTSHRARSTIASQLYNAKDPMSLFELQAWLGHRSPHSTQHYAQITPMTLSKAYADAGYFARNIRAIEVLVDRAAVETGEAARGAPWQYFDLGHGFCTYSFFEQCPHRMACARCDFYVPKQSSRAQLLEAKGSLQRMLATIPLSDDERAAVDDGASAVERLLERLADVPTPSGPTPRELGLTCLPVIAGDASVPDRHTPPLPGPRLQGEI